MVHIPFLSSHWDPNGLHCFITGGSQGLGMSLGQALASRGADVTLVARSEDKLQEAAEAVLAARKSPSQKVAFYPADVSTFAGAREALEWSSTSGESRSAHKASAPVGRTPDAVFACAGGTKPGFFLQQTEEDFRAGAKTNYDTALATAHGAATIMVRNGVAGKIVLVSSTLGLMAMPGYLQYQPNKFAIRGLAEGLRAEMQLYGISVHCYFPGTIYTPGYELENKTKPALTAKIEGAADGLTPEECADKLIKGIQSNHFAITSDIATELFRTATYAGSVPSNFWLLDRLLGGVAQIALPIWRRFVLDKTTRDYAKEHPEEVRNERRDRPHNPYATILTLSLLHRLFVFACLIVLPFLIAPFDSSADLQLLLGSDGSIVNRIASHLIRWDSLHFLGLASPTAVPSSPGRTSKEDGLGGYVYEHSLAFQPGIIYVLRVAGYVSSGSGWDIGMAVLLSSFAAAVVSSAHSVLLYHLLLSAKVYHRIAFAAATLSILPPSPSTLVTPTPEAFFGFFALLSLCFISPPVNIANRQPLSSWLRPSLTRVLISSIFIALATAFRANGVLLVGHLWHALLWQRPRREGAAQLALRAAALLLSTAVAMAPFALNQLWSWNRFCKQEANVRPWCGQMLPYSFVQSHYWNVGLFKYWELAQLPNFILAAPVLIAATHVSLRYYASSPTGILRRTFLGWLPGGNNEQEPVLSQPSPRMALDYHATPRLLPHMHLSTVTTALLLLASHVQIALRFASPAWVGVWLGLAHLIIDPVSGKVNSASGRRWLAWLIGWNILSVILYSAFLPPA